MLRHCLVFFFFFQAEDGIRDYKVTGVQTCALPISICATSNLFGWLWSEQAAEKSDVRVVRAFRPAFKCLLLSTGVGFQPTAGLPFRLFQLPVKPSLSKQWNLRDPYRELLEAEKKFMKKSPQLFALLAQKQLK